MLIKTLFAGVLVLYTLPDKTVLCYIYKLQSQVASAHVLGMCKLPGTIVCLIHTLQNEISYSDVMDCVSSGKTLLCYITKLQSQIPFTYTFGFVTFSTKLPVLYALHHTIRVSTLQHLPPYWKKI